MKWHHLLSSRRPAPRDTHTRAHLLQSWENPGAAQEGQTPKGHPHSLALPGSRD